MLSVIFVDMVVTIMIKPVCYFFTTPSHYCFLQLQEQSNFDFLIVFGQLSMNHSVFVLYMSINGTTNKNVNNYAPDMLPVI